MSMIDAKEIPAPFNLLKHGDSIAMNVSFETINVNNVSMAMDNRYVAIRNSTAIGGIVLNAHETIKKLKENESTNAITL